MVLWQQHPLPIQFRIVTFQYRASPNTQTSLWTKTIMGQLIILFIILIYVPAKKKDQSWENSYGPWFGWLQLLEMQLKLHNSNVKICLFVVTHPLQIITYFFLCIYFSHPFYLEFYICSLRPLTELHTVTFCILNECGHSFCRQQVKESWV